MPKLKPSPNPPYTTLRDFFGTPLPKGTSCDDCGKEIKPDSRYWRLKEDTSHICCYPCILKRQRGEPDAQTQPPETETR